MTLCPEKHEQSVFGRRWERDLGLDLRAVADWEATARVYLIERSEVSLLGVGDLGDAPDDHGTEPCATG